MSGVQPAQEMAGVQPAQEKAGALTTFVMSPWVPRINSSKLKGSIAVT